MLSRSVCCFVTICPVAVALLFINADGGLLSANSIGIFDVICEDAVGNNCLVHLFVHDYHT